VLEARDGLEGLSLLVREPVDVVLCDLAMPKLDGDKLLREGVRRRHPVRLPDRLGGRSGGALSRPARRRADPSTRRAAARLRCT
jgi:CheY-like chemotaxis protein